MSRRRCCCGPGRSCFYFSDDFGRPDSTDLGSSWLEYGSADWQIKDGKLYSPGGSGTALCNVPHPIGARSATLLVKGSGGSTDAVFRIVCDYVDEDNYFYVDFRFVSSVSSVIYIGERSSGTDTDLFSNGMEVGIADGLEVTFSPDVELPSQADHEYGVGGIFVDTQDGSQGGGSRRITIGFDQDVQDRIDAGYSTFGLANASDKAIYFDDFQISEYWDTLAICARSCLCRHNTETGSKPEVGKHFPREMTLTFSNVDSCPDIDGWTVPIYQIQNPLHPNYPNAIPTDGLSYATEWRSGEVYCPGSLPCGFNWTFTCGAYCNDCHNQVPDDVPLHSLQEHPTYSGTCVQNWVGPYDNCACGGNDHGHPDSSSTCDPLYLRFNGTGTEASGGGVSCCNDSGGYGEFLVELTE